MERRHFQNQFALTKAINVGKISTNTTLPGVEIFILLKLMEILLFMSVMIMGFHM